MVCACHWVETPHHIWCRSDSMCHDTCPKAAITMAPKQGKKNGLRGPPRKPNSEAKLLCAYARCNSGVDVKNIRSGLVVAKEDIDLNICRPSLRRGNVKLIRFCCDRHLQRCQNKKAPKLSEGRHALDGNQIAAPFHHACERWRPVGSSVLPVAGSTGRARRMCHSHSNGVDIKLVHRFFGCSSSQYPQSHRQNHTTCEPAAR